MEGELTRILGGLVGINSVSARPNEPVISFIEQELAGDGWQLERRPYQRDGEQRINLIVRSSRESDPELAFVGHTDTVPWDAGWTEATTLIARDGRLYGRGTCDMKGFLACMIAAARSIEPARLRRPLVLIFTADEEIGCVGAKQLAEDGSVRPRRAIVGEPTSLQPVRAGKGYGLAEVVVRGREAHSAYPQQGRSAIVDAARLITAIDQLAKEQARNVHPFFDPPFTTVNIGLVQGGSAKNIIAGECRVTVEWRPVAGESAEAFPRRLSAVIDELRRTGEVADVSIHVMRSESPFETPTRSDLVQYLEKWTGSPATSVAFGTEAPQMARLGADTVVCGPGDMRVAHRTGESVSMAELLRCVQMLQAAAKAFCA
jgi:acetylornithine deacetylase